MCDAFSEFLHRLPFYGVAVLCIDDPEVAALADSTPRHVMTYGFDDRAEVRADAVTQEGPRMRFELCLPDGTCTRSEEHTSELQSLMRISYAVFCLNKKHNETN